MAGVDSLCFWGWGKGFPCFPSASPAIPSPLLPRPVPELCDTTSPAGMSEGCMGTLDAKPASAWGQQGFAWAVGFLLQMVGAGRCVPIPTSPPGNSWCSRWPVGPVPRELQVKASSHRKLAAGTLPGQPPQPWLSAWLGTLGGAGTAAVTACSLPIQKRAAHRFLTEGSLSAVSPAWQASPCPETPRRGPLGRSRAYGENGLG